MGNFIKSIGSLLIFSMLGIYYSNGMASNYRISSFNRSSFPNEFLFGAASSAYQIEGAASEDGKGPSIWDTFTHRYPEKIRDVGDGSIGIDSYHLYKEDIRLVKQTGLNAYRFSISWPRLLPSGTLSRGINEKGIDYYNNLINQLVKQGIEPFITLFHWDLPQALEDEYHGFLSPKIVNDFRDYSELCFKRFGDRVKYWITLNEPYTYVTGGYVTGELAPGRCSAWLNRNCTGGESAVEPYIVAHHQLLAHAAAVKIYKEKYQGLQKGQIGISLVAQWMVPFSRDRIHRAAATRAIDFSFGWFMKPLTKGYYPKSMKSRVKERLPKFSKEEKQMLNGSLDFVGLNYYTTYYARNLDLYNSTNLSYATDSQTQTTPERNGVFIGPKGASDWLYVYPRGLHDFLLYVKRTYNSPTIYITENGIDESNNSTSSLQQSLADNMRIDYYFNHLSFVHKAIKKGVDVKGFFAWSLMDNFEWSSGYSLRFGLHYVDYSDGLKRYPKLSASWFSNFLHI